MWSRIYRVKHKFKIFIINRKSFICKLKERREFNRKIVLIFTVFCSYNFIPISMFTFLESEKISVSN
jgi:hypothetical protein